MSTRHTIGGRAYPVRHYPIAVRLRDRKGRAILCIALNPQSGDFSGAILGVRSVALLHLGLLPEIDREDSIENNLKNRAILVKGTEKRKTPFMFKTQMARKLWNDCIMY